ncbi:MAG TPA: ubiquinol oxidase subunit II [Xanthobacteraceae bacterium]|nr:ubiquinol oxidase subunit II [Xanthobacteraceae bacterium]
MRQASARAPADKFHMVIGRRGPCAAVMVGAAITLAGCSGGVLQPQGPVGGANALILLNAVGIMSVIVVPTIIAALVFAWWFRASNRRARFRPDFVYSGQIELLVWSVPLLVILFLGGVIWIGSHALDPYRPIAAQTKPLEVQVVALDWKWLFIYPDQGVASVNEAVVPAERPVHFSITSASVMNQFFVPQLGSMIAAMNGMVTQLHLQADHPGDYYGLSAQYSGDGFSGMHFLLRAVPQDAFTQWVATARASGPTLDRAGYARLAQQSQDVKPYTYRAIDPSLFQAVASREIAPAPGPDISNASAQVHPKGGR